MVSSPVFPQWAIAKDPVAVSSQCALSDIAALLKQRQQERQFNPATCALASTFNDPEALSVAAVQDLKTPKPQNPKTPKPRYSFCELTHFVANSKYNQSI